MFSNLSKLANDPDEIRKKILLNGYEESHTSTVPTPVRPWDKGNKITIQSPLITTGM